MARFTKASLETLKQRVDLVEVLSAEMELKRAGSSYKGLCPFHDEKSPSFVVQKGDSHYHCFGCGAHGDAIQFLMQQQGMSFADAVENLAQRFNVPLEKADSKESDGPQRRLLREALELASRFFHYLLLHTPEGHEALHYLYGRGIDLDFIRQFQIGYAPPQPGVFQKFMQAHKVRRDVLLAAGLLSPTRTGSLRDFFSDRITFPVRDSTGMVVGFSSRKFKEGTFGGKYINTPEGPLFKKSRLLFGLHESRRRIAKERRAIVVEGQLDCLRLIREGFNLAVAAQATAFGEGHVEELLKLGVGTVVLAMDADHAGRQAAIKIGQLFQIRGIEIKVVSLPLGTDPDTLLMTEGPEAFQSLVDEADDYLNFLMDEMKQDYPIDSPAGKKQWVRAVAAKIRQWEDPIMVHEGLRKLARHADVPEEMVGVGQQEIRNLYIRQQDTLGLLREDINPDRILELDILRWLLIVGESREDLVSFIRHNLKSSDFHLVVCRQLFDSYIEAFDAGKPRDLLSLAIYLGEEESQELIDDVFRKKVNEDRAEIEIEETLKRLLERNWMRRREKIRARLEKGDLSDEEALELAKEFEEVKRQAPIIERVEEMETT